MSVLQQICAQRRRDVERCRFEIPLSTLVAKPDYRRTCHSLRAALTRDVPVRVIAEHKRASPSQGDYGNPTPLEDVVRGYAEAGAVALSVLTEPNWFGGELGHLLRARTLTSLPLLRKDFTVHGYQVHEAKAAGADAILLIAAALTLDLATQLAEQAHNIGLEVLLELHAADELDYLAIAPDVIGVNNRDLATLTIDLASSEALAGQLPRDRPRISESGIQTPADAARVLAAGYDGVLVGTQFMQTAHPGAALKSFLDESAAAVATPKSPPRNDH